MYGDHRNKSDETSLVRTEKGTVPLQNDLKSAVGKTGEEGAVDRWEKEVAGKERSNHETHIA